MRPIALFSLMLLGLTACPPAADDSGGVDSGDTDTDDGEVTFEDFVNVTEPINVHADGDVTCWTVGDDFQTQEVDIDKQSTVTVTGEVRDFESDDRVTDATVQIFNEDDPSVSPDAIATSNQNGEVTLDVPLCQPSAYKVTTDDGETKETYEVHQMYEDGVTPEWNSVSRVTYNIIPALLGISPDPDKSIIAGTAFDCNEEPIEGAQVVVTIDGEIPESLIVKYFVDDFPNRDQPHTSADGLWVAVNVPVGEAVVELWGIPEGGTEVQLLGATELSSFADSINISNIHWGFGQGIKYPASCLVAAE